MWAASVSRHARRDHDFPHRLLSIVSARSLRVPPAASSLRNRYIVRGPSTKMLETTACPGVLPPTSIWCSLSAKARLALNQRGLSNRRSAIGCRLLECLFIFRASHAPSDSVALSSGAKIEKWRHHCLRRRDGLHAPDRSWPQILLLRVHGLRSMISSRGFLRPAS